MLPRRAAVTIVGTPPTPGKICNFVLVGVFFSSFYYHTRAFPTPSPCINRPHSNDIRVRVPPRCHRRRPLLRWRRHPYRRFFNFFSFYVIRRISRVHTTIIAPRTTQYTAPTVLLRSRATARPHECRITRPRARAVQTRGGGGGNRYFFFFPHKFLLSPRYIIIDVL